jgi:hypothetical protein
LSRSEEVKFGRFHAKFRVWGLKPAGMPKAITLLLYPIALLLYPIALLLYPIALLLYPIALLHIASPQTIPFFSALNNSSNTAPIKKLNSAGERAEVEV